MGRATGRETKTWGTERGTEGKWREERIGRATVANGGRINRRRTATGWKWQQKYRQEEMIVRNIYKVFFFLYDFL